MAIDFTATFISSCTPLQISATLPASATADAMLWAHDKTHHITALYCGCEDARAIRNGRNAYTVCAAHGLQPLGHAARIRKNKEYAK